MPGILKPQIIAAALIASAPLALAPHTVFAAPGSQAGHGLELTRQYCAGCHVVAPSNVRGWTDAPAFDAIANREGTTAATLRAFIQQPHMHMLNTARPPEEANSIAAYIMTLRKQ